ncbi:hypothetical protein AHAS_Ahas07G0167600 [Arachis hypogaea]
MVNAYHRPKKLILISSRSFSVHLPTRLVLLSVSFLPQPPTSVVSVWLGHSSLPVSHWATVALPPTFYREFRSELPDEVRFVDPSGRRFTMLLHKTPALCLIVAGFPQLINAFTIKERCWFFMAYLGDAEFLMFHVLEVNAPLLAAGVSPMYPLAVHELLGNACGNLAAYFVPALSQDEDFLLPHSIHSNLPSVIYPMGDTYTIQFASTIQNLPMLSLLLDIYFTFATDYEAKPLDYRAFASMLGHYSNFCPGSLHSLLPNREAVVVDKLISKYQAAEYILVRIYSALRCVRVWLIPFLSVLFKGPLGLNLIKSTLSMMLVCVTRSTFARSQVGLESAISLRGGGLLVSTTCCILEVALG